MTQTAEEVLKKRKKMLTKEQYFEVIKLLIEGKMTDFDIADKFGISCSAVRGVASNARSKGFPIPVRVKGEDKWNWILGQLRISNPEAYKEVINKRKNKR